MEEACLTSTIFLSLPSNNSTLNFLNSVLLDYFLPSSLIKAVKVLQYIKQTLALKGSRERQGL